MYPPGFPVDDEQDFSSWLYVKIQPREKQGGEGLLNLNHGRLSEFIV